MTKAELEKEAEDWVKANTKVESCPPWGDVKITPSGSQGYLAGAEPREKRIAELEDKLANADYQLEGRDNEIRELKEQIQKMKRCEICKHYRWNHCSYEINISEDCIQNKLKHFELKEIKEK